MATVIELAREILPDVPDDELGAIIWDWTGFPSFWKTDNPEEEMRQQLIWFRDTDSCPECHGNSRLNLYGICKRCESKGRIG